VRPLCVHVGCRRRRSSNASECLSHHARDFKMWMKQLWRVCSHPASVNGNGKMSDKMCL
jgi:hypothetical protein